MKLTKSCCSTFWSSHQKNPYYWSLVKIHQDGADIFNKTGSFEVSIGLLTPISIVPSKESLNKCRFLILFDNINKLNFSTVDQYFSDYKLLPVNLTWLHQVYREMFYFARHPLLMVSVEYLSLWYFCNFWLADVIAIWLYAKCGGICLPLLFYYVADVIATLLWVLNWIVDRCYFQCSRWKATLMIWWQMLLPLWLMEKLHCQMADVIAIMADGIAT